MYGFVITRLGMSLLLKWGAGAPRILTDIMVGSGRVADGVSLATLTDLVTPVAKATSNMPKVENQELSFMIEYRNDLNGGQANGFWLNEYGVFAEDPDLGRVMLCYATLGDYPQYVVAYTGGAIDIRRFPVTIGLSDNVNVIINYPPVAFVLSEDLQEAIDALKTFKISGEMLYNYLNYGYIVDVPQVIAAAIAYPVLSGERLNLTPSSTAPYKPPQNGGRLVFFDDFAYFGAGETLLLNYQPLSPQSAALTSGFIDVNDTNVLNGVVSTDGTVLTPMVIKVF